MSAREWIVVLNDGETYTTLEGCVVAVMSRDEEVLNDADASGDAPVDTSAPHYYSIALENGEPVLIRVDNDSKAPEIQDPWEVGRKMYGDAT